MFQLFWLILLPVLAAAAGMLFPLKINKALALLLQVFMVIAAFINLMVVKATGTVVQNVGGWPDFIGISLRADITASAMVLMTTVLFLFMVMFNLKREYVTNMFLFLFTAMEGLILGIFLSNDLFNIFVLVEVSTVIISILIMFKKDSRAIYDGMLYMLTNITAMTFFLFGIGILYKTLGVLDLTGLKTAIARMDEPRSLLLPYAMILTAVCLKSALMPLFSWLPKAHGTPSAPSVVSALLSGIYIKSGIYLFLRIQNVFSDVIDTNRLFLILGFITAVVGFLLAIAQKDIKLILAYHTVSQIGLVMMGISMDNPQTHLGAVYHIMNHAVFKSTLFLTAGMIIEEYKTRDIYRIHGVFKRMPLVAVSTLISIFGITGAPFFSGSISKYWISYGAKGSWAEYGLILVNLGTMISFIKYAGILFGREPQIKNKANPIRNTVVFIMGILCFLGGIFGDGFMRFLLNADLTVSIASYLTKTLIFAAILLTGILIYYGWLKNAHFLKKAGKFEIGFNGICLTMTLFFAFILAYLWFDVQRYLY